MPCSWSAVLQVLNSGRSPYARFFKVLANLSNAPTTGVPAASTGSTAPFFFMTLSYPEVERCVALECGSRRIGQETKRLITKRWVNRLVGLFGFYLLGADSFNLFELRSVTTPHSYPNAVVRHSCHRSPTVVLPADGPRPFAQPRQMCYFQCDLQLFFPQ